MKKFLLVLSGASLALSMNAAENTDSSSVKDSSQIFKELELREVTVKAQARVVSVKDGDIIMRVSGTSLAQEVNVDDVLSKIPGMLKDQNGNLVSFKGDEPVYYLDGRKVLDFSVIENMPVQNIKDVRLITSPGAKYGAGVETVVSIRTRRSSNSFSAQLDNEYARNHYNSNSHSLFAQYSGKKLILEGVAGYADDRNYSVENVDLANSSSPAYRNSISTKSITDTNKKYNYQLSAILPFSDSFELGVQYDGWKSDNHNANAMDDSTFMDHSVLDRVSSVSHIKDGGHLNHLNGYLYAAFNEKLKFNAYGDWLNNKLTRTQDVDETSLSGSDKVTINGRSVYDIYAEKVQLDYLPTKKNTFSIGAEYSYTHGKSAFRYSDDLSNSDYVTKERKAAAYADYSGTFGKFNVTAGLRYEHVGERQRDNLATENSTDRSYNNLFPSFSVSYATQPSVSHSLKYRSGIRRPDFSWMSTSSTYVNRFMRQVGSPTLKPQLRHQIDYSFMYKNFFLQCSYTYNHDYLGVNIYKSEQHPEVFISSWKNYNHEQELMFLTGYRYRIGMFEPTWSTGFQQHIMSVEYLGEKKKLDKPFWFFKLNNILRLPWKIRCNIDWNYMSSGEQTFVRTRPISVVNIGFQKEFLSDRLTVTLRGDDIFKGGINRFTGGIGDVSMNEYIYRDARAFSIHLSWKINNAKHKYSSESAAESEIKRLNY